MIQIPAKELFGRILTQSDTKSEIADVLEKLKPEHFPNDQQQAIFKLFLSMSRKRLDINFLTTHHEAKKISTEDKATNLVCYLTECFDDYQFTRLEDSLRLLKENHITGKIKALGSRIQEGNVVDDLHQYQRELAELDNEKVVVDANEHAIHAILARNEPQGISTGFDFFDDYTKKLKAGHVWILGAYAKTGKTTLACQILEHAHRLKEKPKICFISLEMSPKEITERLFSIKAERGINENQALDEMLHMPFDIVDHIHTLNGIERHIEENSYDLVFIDYLQIIDHKEKSEYEGMNSISRSLKITAKKNNCCIFALSQISNETQKSGKAGQLGFKGSGSILANCDVGIFLTRNFDNEQGLGKVPVNVYIRANRHGMQGAREFTFDKKPRLIFQD